jgi:hypothetical protein
MRPKPLMPKFAIRKVESFWLRVGTAKWEAALSVERAESGGK